MTRLLVSVRNAKEAKTAWLAGAGLIDAKEPSRGPLGSCDEATWAAVAEAVGTRAPLSAALGEWSEWADCEDSQVRESLSALRGYRYAKLGPANSRFDDGRGWSETLSRLHGLGPRDLAWIAVVYADGDRCAATDRESILQAALRTGCAGLLIDTWDKCRRHDWNDDWRLFVTKARSEGLIVALAGGLTMKTMRRLEGLSPDWFAVRGAACLGGSRNDRVSFRRVRKLAKTYS